MKTQAQIEKKLKGVKADKVRDRCFRFHRQLEINIIKWVLK